MEARQHDEQIIAAEVVVKLDTAHHPAEPMGSGCSERIFADASDSVEEAPESASDAVRSR
jgi:hypothetical protein